MKYLRERALAGETLAGTWLSLGSSVTAEMAGKAGFDWALVDLEHGVGDHESLLHQLQALDATPAAGIVRVAWNEPPRFKRALDLGASGIMVPYVNTAQEASLAASAMRFPPRGIRGVARSNRAAAFGSEFDDYFARASENLLTVVQIETVEAVENAGAIAAVDGVDVLFIGPLDLSVSLGIPQQSGHPDFLAALARVVAACKGAGKAAGILLPSTERLSAMQEMGFTFVAVGTDGGLVMTGMRQIAAAFGR